VLGDHDNVDAWDKLFHREGLDGLARLEVDQIDDVLTAAGRADVRDLVDEPVDAAQVGKTRM
jgi:hypothetical protein